MELNFDKSKEKALKEAGHILYIGTRYFGKTLKFNITSQPN